MIRHLSSFLLAVALGIGAANCWANDGQPNIVVVLADDLGYGDVEPLNPDSEIATPAFRRLATEGLTFTDAHSPSGVCTPTRYGLVCGRYCWRTRLKRGVLGGYSKPLISRDQQTIASVLKASGYTTVCIGKWHLGLGWQWKKDPPNINSFGVAGGRGFVNYDQPLTDTPIHHGFDHSYIIPASLDMSPYVYIEDNRPTRKPTNLIPGKSFPAFYRKGEIADNFKIIETLDHLTQRTVDTIGELAAKPEPYFLYCPLPAPHKPVIPTAEYQGKSSKGPYGDFIMQVDAAVGRIVDAIAESGEDRQTILIVTSDNGSFMHRRNNDQEADHVTNHSVQAYNASTHTANGPLRGTKADVWEGGHRVPFFVRWPGTASANQQVHQTVCHVDLLATCAELAGADFSEDASEDSFSFTSLLDADASDYERPPVIHHSSAGMFAIRSGKWKLVLGNGSGGRAAPKGKPFAEPYHLFDMESDISETQNLIGQHAEIQKRLMEQFEEIAHGDHK